MEVAKGASELIVAVIALCMTLWDLNIQDQVLDIGCMSCRQHRFCDPAGLNYPDDTAIDEIAGLLTCKFCGFSNKVGRVMLSVRASKYRRTDLPLFSWKEKTPAIEDIALGFLLSSQRHMEAECIHCGARQHVDIDALIEQHRRAATLREIAPTIPCFFCRRQGMKIYELP